MTKERFCGVGVGLAAALLPMMTAAAQSLPGQSMPAQSLPVQSTPAQSTPAQGGAGAVPAAYTVSARWKVGGEGSWGYLLADGASHQMYLPHNTRVEVVDTATGKLVGAVTGLKNARGVVLDRDGKTGYITDAGSNTVVLFDRLSLEKIVSLPAGKEPDTIAFDSATRTVWAFNRASQDVTEIDAETRKVMATVPLPGRPEFATSDNKGTVYVNIQDRNEIARIDTAVGKVLVIWPLGGCEAPAGMAIDRIGHRLFSGCRNGSVAVVDASSGEPLATVPLGGAPASVAYDPAHRVLFSSDRDGSLSVIDASGRGYRTTQTLNTEPGAVPLSVDLSTGRVYLPAGKQGAAPGANAASSHSEPAVVPDSFGVLVVSR